MTFDQCTFPDFQLFNKRIWSIPPPQIFNATESVAPAIAIKCKRLPGLHVNACEFQVTPADILDAQCWPTYWAASCSQLTIQEVLWYTAVLHATYMTAQTESTLAKHEMHAKRTCFLQHSNIGDFVLSSDAHDPSQAVHMEAFQAVLLSGVCRPRLAAVQ